jgi:hypothetical protein
MQLAGTMNAGFKLKLISRMISEGKYGAWRSRLCSVQISVGEITAQCSRYAISFFSLKIL